MPRPAASTSWERVSSWYKTHLKQEDFLQRDVVIPSTLELLSQAAPGPHLDIACGEGTFAEAFRSAFPRRPFVGLDAAPSLIRGAQQKRIPQTHFLVGNAERLPSLADAPFSSASCILAIQNIEDIVSAFRSLTRVLEKDAPSSSS
jgi:ubiquinone/menaquinone biosynthesis C-methylase UbiE